MLSHCAVVLELLADGRPHSAQELLGLHVMGHSRVSDLRKAGYRVAHWQKRDARSGRQVHLYELRGVPAVPSRFEEQLEAGGAWGAVGLLRRLRAGQYGDAGPVGFSRDGGAVAPSAPASVEAGASVPPGAPADLLVELGRVEDELASLQTALTLDDYDRVCGLQQRQRELEQLLGAGVPGVGGAS